MTRRLWAGAVVGAAVGVVVGLVLRAPLVVGLCFATFGLGLGEVWQLSGRAHGPGLLTIVAGGETWTRFADLVCAIRPTVRVLEIELPSQVWALPRDGVIVVVPPGLVGDVARTARKDGRRVNVLELRDVGDAGSLEGQDPDLDGCGWAGFVGIPEEGRTRHTILPHARVPDWFGDVPRLAADLPPETVAEIATTYPTRIVDPWLPGDLERLRPLGPLTFVVTPNVLRQLVS